MSTSIRLSVSGMHCAGCVASVEKALNGVFGVTLANVNFAEHTATIEGDVSAQPLVDAVRSAGYDAAEMTGAEDEAEKEAAELGHYRKLLKMAAFAAVVGFPQFIFCMAGYLPGFATGAVVNVTFLGKRFGLARGFDHHKRVLESATPAGAAGTAGCVGVSE